MGDGATEVGAWACVPPVLIHCEQTIGPTTVDGLVLDSSNAAYHVLLAIIRGSRFMG